MKLVIAGGSGFLGEMLCKGFRNRFSEISVLTRQPSFSKDGIHYHQWDGKSQGDWVRHLEACDVLINLTGKSVDCRYNEKNKRLIVESRVNATRALEKAINGLEKKPVLWMNAASATIYGYSEDQAMDEYSGVIGSGFSVEVCKAWEKVFEEAVVPGVRKVVLRISMVMGRSGGVFPVLKKLTRNFLGGTMGNGRQYISWIHEADFLAAIGWLIDHPECEGPYNLASPQPLPNKQFNALLRNKLHRKLGLPASKWMLEIGAFFLQTETELVLKSRKVVPTRLLNEGFQFQFPTVDKALSELCK